MSHRLTIAVSSALFLGLGQSALAQDILNFNANVEVDSDIVGAGQAEARQGGRVELNTLAQRALGDYFILGKGTMVMRNGGDLGTDDMYLKLGSSLWDLQLGRFEAADLFPKGKDVIVEHAGGVTVYEANFVRGRANEGGQIALHVNATDNLQFELATFYGDNDTLGADGKLFSGVRPSINYKGDRFLLGAGIEALRREVDGDTFTQMGYGLTAGVELGGNLLRANFAQLDDKPTGGKVTTLGLNVLRGNFGAGLVHSLNDGAGAGGDPEVTTVYAGYTIPLLGLDGASITFGASYSLADNVSGDDSLAAARVRFNYAMF
jgi:hypothetical protein